MCDRVTTDLDLETTTHCDSVSAFHHVTRWDDGEVVVQSYCRPHSRNQREVDADLYGLVEAVYTAIPTIDADADAVVSDVTEMVSA